MIRTQERRQALVLLASEEDVSADSLAQSLVTERFGVVRAPTTEALFERGAALEPDAVILELDPPPAKAGSNICRALVRQGWMDATTPVMVTTHGALASDERLALLRAGAWDVLQRPVDPRELIVRLYHYLTAKQESDRVRSSGLVDPETGYYNLRGLQRRCEELTADAFRRHAPLACLAIRPAVPDPEALSDLELQALAAKLREMLRSTRRSDVIGRPGPVEFCVLAPRTDAEGAVGLAQRLLRATDVTEPRQRARFRVGYEAVPNVHDAATDPQSLLQDAIEAARRSPENGITEPIRPFRPFEHRQPHLPT
jgi:PleD family two-component response regulator